MKDEETLEKCEHCGGTFGEHLPIEVMGGSAGDEWGVVGYRSCPNGRED